MFDATPAEASVSRLRPLKGVQVVMQPSSAAPSTGGGCGSSGGSGKASCGSSAGAGDLPAHIWDKVKNHPCYSEEAHHHFARMHVAVAPACNIQCNYCNRKYDCANESRPGVVSERLSPEQAAKKVLAVASEIPQLSVVGIAGPGDPLANPAKTFRTFELIAQQAPDIRLCVSTNGLALPALAEQLGRYNIDHVTITINAVDPKVGARIYPWIFHEHKRHYGEDAARILLENQLRGLELLTARGILTKINSVLIPGVNDEHLIEVNRAVKSRGAFLHNIMPLISAPEHGTVFGITGQRGPSAQELKQVQDACEGGANLMRHCRQCRADAVGLLGEDRSDEFSAERIETMDVSYDPARRQAYREQVEAERARHHAAKQAQAAELARALGEEDIAILVAVATKGGGKINEHFGHARELQIYEATRGGAKFVGHRRIDLYCQGGWGEDDLLPSVVRAINDCHAVLVAKIGRCPKDELAAAGIEPVDEYAFQYIEQGVLDFYRRYLARVRAGELVHRPRTGSEHEAAIRQGALMPADAAAAAAAALPAARAA